MSKKIRTFFRSLMIWTILLIVLELSLPASAVPTIQTSNVLIGQTVKIQNKNGNITEIYVPTGSVALAPAYFDRLSESIALKDKLLAEGNVARPIGNLGLLIEKRLYIDTFYGLKSGPELMVGGRLDFVL